MEKWTTKNIPRASIASNALSGSSRTTATLFAKFFFTISRKEQAARMKKLQRKKDTAWRVSENDIWQNAHYEKCQDVFSQYMSDTNTSNAPWYIVDAEDKKWAELQVLETLVSGIEVALQNQSLAVPILPKCLSSGAHAQNWRRFRWISR